VRPQPGADQVYADSAGVRPGGWGRAKKGRTRSQTKLGDGTKWRPAGPPHERSAPKAPRVSASRCRLASRVFEPRFVRACFARLAASLATRRPLPEAGSAHARRVRRSWSPSLPRRRSAFGSNFDAHLGPLQPPSIGSPHPSSPIRDGILSWRVTSRSTVQRQRLRRRGESASDEVHVSRAWALPVSGSRLGDGTAAPRRPQWVLPFPGHRVPP